MNIDPYILTFSALTVIATIWMGFWSAKRSKTASDFFVAGRSVSVGWNASAISGEYLSAASFMGVAGMVMSSGYDALWYPVCYACGYLFLLLFIAGPLRRFGAYTIPDFAEGRFDSPLFRKIAVIFVLFIGFFYTMPQMKGAGTTLAYIFPGLPYWVGVALVGAVITLNVALGGMKGITLVQAFQYWAKMFAISVPIFVLMAVYGDYGTQIGLNASKSTTPRAALPPKKPFTYIFVLTETNFSIQKVVKEIKTIGGLEKYVVASTNPTSATVHTWLFNYAVVAKRPNRTFTVYAPQDMEGLWSAILVSQPEPMTRSELVHHLERCFETNGYHVARVGSDAAKVFPLAQASEYSSVLAPGEIREESVRLPLPEKAPADSTWLSPFGPLTAKAAKTAKSSLTYSGNLVRQEIRLSGDSAKAKLEWLERKYFPTGKPLGTKVYTGTELFMNYAALQVMSQPASLSQSVTVNWSDEIEELRISVSYDGPKDYGSAAHYAFGLLSSNGVTIVRDPGNAFRAFPTKDAVITPMDTRPYALLYTYSLIIALVCGTAGLPHILVRFYTNPDGVAAKRTTMWVMILIGVFYLFPPVFGVMGRNLLPELYAGVGAKGTDKVVLELPRILNAKGAHASGVQSGASRVGQSENKQAVGETPTAAGGTPALPNESEIANQESKIPWGSILSGITCAGAFAAFMSTFSGLLVSLTGALAHDVYGRIFRPKSTPDQRMRMFKVCAVVCGSGAILLGFFVEKFEINKMVGWAFAIAATSYFPLLFLSTWWRGITMKGAATGMLTGGTLSLIAIASTMFADQAAWAKGLADFYAIHPLLRILAEQPAIWALPLAIVLMVVVSKLTAKDVPSDIRMKMLVLHAPEKLGLKQEYIQEHQAH
jgi:Na+(H+)/acetate symporter ActP